MSSEKANTTLLMFQRAQSMKRKNDGSVIIKQPTIQKHEQKEPLITTDEEIISRFSNKYGLPFSLNHSHKNGSTPFDGNTTKFFNNNRKEDGDENLPSSTTDRTARDRFRSAGMKARFAKRMEKIVEDRMTVKQIFNRYVQNSTLHGFRFIFMKTFVIRRIAWALLTCTMAAVFFMELKNSVELFFEYPFTTTSTVEYVPSLNFPAISICNLNNIQISKIRNGPLEKIYHLGQLPFNVNSKDPGYDISGKELDEILIEASQSVENLFYNCEWKSRDTAKTGIPNLCGVQNFSTYRTLYGQTCFTFNPAHSGHRLLSLNETGLNMALKLELNLRGNESLRGMQDVGLNVIVHDQQESPLQQAGFVVSPGFQTFVEMKVRKTENLQPPYATKCGERQLKYYPVYRQSKCFVEQLSDLVKMKCRCRVPFMPDKSIRPCSLNETITCAVPTIHKFDRKTSENCPVDCSTLQYITSLSYARFLSKPPTGTLLIRDDHDHWIGELKKTMSAQKLQQYVEENIVVIQFFYQEMKEENVKQEPSYDFYKLVGDVGGQLGLMLGASVLTLVEFVDLFLFTFYHQLLRLSRKKKRENETRIGEKQ